MSEIYRTFEPSDSILFGFQLDRPKRVIEFYQKYIKNIYVNYGTEPPDSILIVVPDAGIKWYNIGLGLKRVLWGKTDTTGNIFMDLDLRFVGFYKNFPAEDQFLDWNWIRKIELEYIDWSQLIILFKDNFKYKRINELHDTISKKIVWFQYVPNSQSWDKTIPDKGAVVISIEKFQDMQLCNAAWKHICRFGFPVFAPLGGNIWGQLSPKGWYWECRRNNYAYCEWMRGAWRTTVLVDKKYFGDDVEKCVNLRNRIRDRIFEYYAGL